METDELKFAKSIWNSNKYFNFPQYFHFSESRENINKMNIYIQEEFFSNLYDSSNSSPTEWTPPLAGFYLFVLWSENYSLFIMDFYWSSFVWGFISFLENSLLFFWPHHIACRILIAQPGMPKDWIQATAEKTLNSNHLTNKELPQDFFFFHLFYNFVDSGRVFYIKLACFFIVSVIFVDNLFNFLFIDTIFSKKL